MGLRATDGTRGMWGDRPPGPLGATGRCWAQLTKESPLQPPAPAAAAASRPHPQRTAGPPPSPKAGPEPAHSVLKNSSSTSRNFASWVLKPSHY